MDLCGAVFLGTTNTPEFGHKGDTTNLLVGSTKNPYDKTLTAGGSSGGAAAAIACGVGAFALGKLFHIDLHCTYSAVCLWLMTV